MKKGQGLSLNVIIVAAIVLIVLIVLWAIFTGRMGDFTTGLSEQDLAAKAEAEKFMTGDIAVNGVCGTVGTCLSSCAAGKEPILLSNKPAAERCDTGLICCTT